MASSPRSIKLDRQSVRYPVNRPNIGGKRILEPGKYCANPSTKASRPLRNGKSSPYSLYIITVAVQSMKKLAIPYPNVSEHDVKNLSPGGNSIKCMPTPNLTPRTKSANSPYLTLLSQNGHSKPCRARMAPHETPSPAPIITHSYPFSISSNVRFEGTAGLLRATSYSSGLFITAFIRISGCRRAVSRARSPCPVSLIT